MVGSVTEEKLYEHHEEKVAEPGASKYLGDWAQDKMTVAKTGGQKEGKIGIRWAKRRRKPWGKGDPRKKAHQNGPLLLGVGLQNRAPFALEEPREKDLERRREERLRTATFQATWLHSERSTRCEEREQRKAGRADNGTQPMEKAKCESDHYLQTGHPEGNRFFLCAL